MAQAAIETYGRIDILVNNAGIYTSLVPTPFEELDVEEWKRVFDVNVLGMYLATRAVTPHMRAAGYGRIVNMASGTPFKGVPFLLHYVSSKGAVLAMTKALAKELVRDQYPEDIVGAVAFFAGIGAAFITGQCLVVDGGAYFN